MKKKFLVELFKKSGVTMTPEFKAIIDAAGDGDVITDVPEAVQASLVSGVLSLQDAQTHPDLINHFKGSLYGATDAAARQALIDEGFTEDEVKGLLDGKPAPEKITIAAKAIKSKTGKPADQIQKDLTKALNDEKAARAQDLQLKDKELADLRGEYSGYKKGTAIDRQLTTGDFKIKTGGLPLPKVMKLIKEDLQDFATEQGIDFDIDQTGAIKLVNTKTPGADIYFNGVKVDGFNPVLQHVLKSGQYLEDASGQPVRGTHTATPPGGAPAPGADSYRASMAANFPTPPATA